MNTKQKYEVAFKKKGSGRLLWFTGFFSDEKEATTVFRKRHETAGHRHKHNGYRLYGGPFLCRS